MSRFAALVARKFARSERRRDGNTRHTDSETRLAASGTIKDVRACGQALRLSFAHLLTPNLEARTFDFVAYDPELTRTLTARAIQRFWATRADQQAKQMGTGRADQGARSAATGGAQMDGFTDLFEQLVEATGVPHVDVFQKKRLELPGFYRPTKKWDLVVMRGRELVAVIEAKSQIGPSFGNNFNNRTEEAIGSASDLWVAYREGAFGASRTPWLGYVFHLEECPRSLKAVEVQEPHFAVFPEFKGASYALRYELLCRRLVRERLYASCAFLLSSEDSSTSGVFREPAADLCIDAFARAFTAHLGAFAQ